MLQIEVKKVNFYFLPLLEGRGGNDNQTGYFIFQIINNSSVINNTKNDLSVPSPRGEEVG